MSTTVRSPHASTEVAAPLSYRNHTGPSGDVPDELTATPGDASQRQGLFYVLLAVLFFSTSPIFIRWAASSLSVYEVAAGRLLIAGIVVLGAALLRRERMPVPREWPRFALFGLVAALHFGFYIASLAYTSIAHSLALIYTAPIFAALLSWRWLGEPLGRRQWLGVVIAVVGVAVMAGFEPQATAQMLFGDLLAVLSAIAFAVYSVIGRSQRHRYSLLAYAGTVYLFAGLWLAPLAASTFSASGYTWLAVVSVLALALLPLGVGHTLYNAALRRTSATLVNLVATQEVTGGIILGILLLGELPGLVAIIGVAITLAGIALVIVQPPTFSKRN